MIIDTHAHYVPEAMLAALKSRGGEFPSVVMTPAQGSHSFAFCGGAPTRPIAPTLTDTEQRLAWMRERRIDHQVVGGWNDIFGYELPAEEGAAWSRFLNDWLLQGTKEIGALTPLATVPLQSGRHAAEVLAEALDSGFAGAMIGTQPHGLGGNLDDPDLDPFWRMASDRGATIFIHPMFGCPDPRVNDFGLANAVGRGADTTIAMSRLLFAGHLQTYSGMTLVVAHGGGALPFLLGRLARNHEIHPGQYADPVEGFRRLYFDSVLFDPAAMRLLCDKVGAAGLSEVELEAVLGGTAARLFHITCGCGG
jgi:aminocarboxymuconate-semialdehyde decarboxylase